MCPLPDLSQAYAMLLQDENQRNAVNSMSLSLDSVAMNARFGQNSASKNKLMSYKKDDKKSSDIVCDYCHLSGHMRDKCFALHG